jgi:heme/copper-type cytochrome/quinol oxidase subunit 3
MLLVILLRTALGHFNGKNQFGLEAVIWFWTFIASIGVLNFISLYGF